jgi:hypothetical protein
MAPTAASGATEAPAMASAADQAGMAAAEQGLQRPFEEELFEVEEEDAMMDEPFEEEDAVSLAGEESHGNLSTIC